MSLDLTFDMQKGGCRKPCVGAVTPTDNGYALRFVGLFKLALSPEQYALELTGSAKS